jgi:hypothetical protein
MTVQAPGPWDDADGGDTERADHRHVKRMTDVPDVRRTVVKRRRVFLIMGRPLVAGMKRYHVIAS